MTTDGDLPDEHEHREHATAMSAWDDYLGRILELEIHGYARHTREDCAYGRRWTSRLYRGPEQIRVTIARTE